MIRFDLLTTALPFYPFESAPQMADRARRLLVNKSDDDVVRMTEEVDFLVDTFFDTEMSRFHEEWRGEDIDPHTVVSTPENTSPLFALRIGLDNNWNENFEPFELLATFALMELRGMHAWLQPSPLRDFAGNAGSILVAASTALVAMDAVASAEQLKNAAEAQKQAAFESALNELTRDIDTAKSKSDHAKRMNQARHGRTTHRAKAYAVEIAREKFADVSAAKASVVIADLFEQDESLAELEVYQPRTIERWILQDRKGR